ncbi:MAG: hypothetical protein ACD_9C00295G0002 [uncultured bacterium]|nr:MAG: hypothetical protein ACD_9C00295G0002 [uncultured bacterium]
MLLVKIGGFMNVAKFGNWITGLLKNALAYFEKIQIGHFFDCFFIALIIVISFFMFEPGLNSSWGLLDDHEIIVYSPASHPLGFSEIFPTLLTKTEINPDSTVPRFRPAYFTLRLLETRIWSAESVFPWYLFRIVLFMFFITSVFLFFKKINGRLIGGLLAFLIATFNFWNGIFSRLGPAETYAILGLSFFLIGTLFLMQNKKSNFAWIIILLGTIIAIGSKENMVIFLVPEIYLVVLFFRMPLKNNIFPFAMLAISLLWTIWIFATVFMRIKTNGSDIYENSVGLSGRLSILGSYVSENIFLILFITMLLIVGIVGYIVMKTKEHKLHFIYLIFGALGIFGLIFSQQIFYSGSIWGRYNFPYALYLPLTISLAAYFLQNLPLINRKLIYNFTTLIISGVLIMFFIQPANLLFVRKIAKEYDFATHQFQSILHDIEYYLTTNSSSSIVFFGSEPERDYERIVSFIRYIRNDSFSNDIFIYNDPPEDFEMTYSKLNVSLEKELMLWSKEGKPEEGIKPMEEFFNNPDDCLLIDFSEQHPELIKCDSIITIQ